MLGAIAGDVIGSCYEFHNIKHKRFPLFSKRSCFTDDTILTCATADWLISGGEPADFLRKWGLKYQNRTYENGSVAAFGRGFFEWLKTEKQGMSRMNGCVMRLSPIPLLVASPALGQKLGQALTLTTHNHPESIKAVQAYLETAYLLKAQIPVPLIKNKITLKYHYDLGRPIPQIRKTYNKFYCSCEHSVSEAIICALDGHSFTDCIRNAISLGGDSDTLATMAGGLAEIRFGVPRLIQKETLSRLDNNILKLLNKVRERA